MNMDFNSGYWRTGSPFSNHDSLFSTTPRHHSMFTNSPIPSVLYNQRPSFMDIIGGVTEDTQREIKVTPDKVEVKESRKLSINSPKRRAKSKAAKCLDFSSCPSSLKIDAYLEKFPDGVFVTRVRFRKGVRWLNVKRDLQALKHHPAIRSKLTVMSAIDKMKTHKTVQISLTTGEALPYVEGQLLEGKLKPTCKRKSTQRSPSKVVNINIGRSKQVCNLGPSTSSRQNQITYYDGYDSDEYNSDDSFNFEQDSSEESTE